jgi:hypothetical protein
MDVPFLYQNMFLKELLIQGFFHDLRELLPLYAVIPSDGSINKRLKIPPSNHAIE